MYKDIVVVSTD